VIAEHAGRVGPHDRSGDLTDILMPAEGTEAHVTLLVAEFLSGRLPKGADAQRPADRIRCRALIENAQQSSALLAQVRARPGAERELGAGSPWSGCASCA